MPIITIAIAATVMGIIDMTMTIHAKTTGIPTIIAIRKLATLATKDMPRARTKAEIVIRLVTKPTM